MFTFYSVIFKEWQLPLHKKVCQNTEIIHLKDRNLKYLIFIYINKHLNSYVIHLNFAVVLYENIVVFIRPYY